MIHPDFLACKWHATYCWKALDKGYNVSSDVISIRGLNTKLWTPKVGTHNFGGSQLWEFWDSHLGILGQNDIWVLVLWPRTKHTIRGKVMASPKSESWWIFWVHGCPWFMCAPKCSNYALTNLLFGLCRSIWINELLVKWRPWPIAKRIRARGYEP